MRREVGQLQYAASDAEALPSLHDRFMGEPAGESRTEWVTS